MWKGYAVVDVETTGLDVRRHDRVIEIGVVQLDRGGRVSGEWATLVNPVRDLGPVGIHGICAADVRQAPPFERIAGTLSGLLAGRMVVAHNLAFDAMFLVAEYARLGVDVPVSAANGLCTMRLASDYLPLAGRSLAACCRAVGVSLVGQHDALHDARAAAGLLVHFLAAVGTPAPWERSAVRAAGLPWPPLPATTVTPVRRGHSTVASQRHFLARLVDRLPHSMEPAVDSYLAVLDGALLDRHISASEADALVDIAERLGLDRCAALTAHRSYLESLAVVAWEDGVVTQAEETDLWQVADMLGLGADDVEQALRRGGWQAGPSPEENRLGRFELRPLDHVVFTGEMNEARGIWEERARAAGLVVGKSVTKKTVLVVAGDPDSLSGKARKARDYKIPIVTEDAFARMLAAMRKQPMLAHD
ncbi:MAG TPA: exonuclease domain-containing protein [Streptosporangiaceae bacterium]|nr:exonuclease domain-containing protein [Streptosporangiaceae bacterium]